MRTQVLLGLLWIGACSQVSAADSAAIADLAKASGCFSCHSAKEKVVGPSFVSIAEKYASDKEGETICEAITEAAEEAEEAVVEVVETVTENAAEAVEAVESAAETLV